MIHLFLSEPTWNDDGDDNAAELIVTLLNKLESIIWSVISCDGRSEARLWLCNSIAGISSINPCHQRELFVKLLRSKPLMQGLVGQVLQMLFEKRPDKAGSILAKKCFMLEKFFEGNPRRILQWFSNLSGGGGELEQSKGAKALSQFAFVNRDICWEELEWKGKHGQSPAMVAAKPHYFLDLDVQQTVENFLENVPEFWSSKEFAESLKGGEILFIDPKYFVDFFVDLIFKEDSREVWDVIDEFLMGESFASLCHRLLIILEERDLCVFLELIQKFLNPEMETKDFGNSSYWLEIALSKWSDYKSVDQLLLLNVVINQGRQLLRLLHDEEGQEEEAKIKDILMQICTISSSVNSLAPLINRKSFKAKTIEVIKWLGLYSWVVHYRLSEECQTSDSWESLFVSNGISFKKSNNYTLLHHEEFSEENVSDLDDRVSGRVKRKKKERKRKKRRRFDHNEHSEDELLNFNTSNNGLALQSSAGSWLLSTDGYSTLWNSMDLPGHLSKHCFSTWMKWVFAKWSNEA